ncbi:MAG: hypothetical protein KDK48_01685 [Chlamydiia bacterium]|nr:hypothetical protein [Chlamydiia bacterium]
MLHFFRKYQRFFFLIVTVVIVISFSFFGAMNVMMQTPVEDPVAFEAVDGARIKRSELEQMAAFLASDSYDKSLYGGVWGPNFLNDGVIQKNFLQTGLAQVLAEEYPALLEADLLKRSAKEKHTTLYHHPKADFISVENAWGFLAPEMKNYYRTVVIGENPLSKPEFDARVNLYLGQRRISPQSLKQVLLYQKRQYSWLPEDPDLYRADLSVFGYHSLDDWFGPNFTRLASSVIINMAKIAEEKGYSVTDAEAYADLMRNALISYDQNKASPYVNVASAQEYLNEQLRRMHMDVRSATKLWKQVLLFRRLYEGFGDSVLVTRETFAPFAEYSGASLEGEIYSLPEALRLSSFTDLQLLQVYLDLVADGGSTGANLPKKFKSPKDIAKVAPELVERKYRLDVATFDLGRIQQRIPLDEMWEWQTSDAGWDKLQEQYSILSVKKSGTPAERFEALESLDPSTRDQVDRTSRELMAKEDTDALSEGIANAPSEVRTLGVRLAGDSPFKGVTSSKEIVELMETALGQGPKAEDAKAKLQNYTQDGRHYFRITVLDREPSEEILTFQDAKKQRILIKILNKKLEEHYAKLKKNDAKRYRTEGGEFQPLADVRMQIARDLFKETLENLDKAHGGQEPMTVEDAASLRLKNHVAAARDAAVQGKSLEAFVRSDASDEPTFADQWLLVKEEYRTARGEKTRGRLQEDAVFDLAADSWTEVNAPAGGDINFFHVLARGQDSLDSAILSSGNQVQERISTEAQQSLMKKLLSDMRERQEIELDYLAARKQA